VVAGAGLGTVARAAAEVACLGGVAQLDGELKFVFFPSRKSCHTHTHVRSTSAVLQNELRDCPLKSACGQILNDSLSRAKAGSETGPSRRGEREAIRRERQPSPIAGRKTSSTGLALKRWVAGSKQRRIAPHGLGRNVLEARGVGPARKRGRCGFIARANPVARRVRVKELGFRCAAPAVTASC
jgi:hypothetical protein